MSTSPNLTEVDWSTIPAPEDDGAAARITGRGVARLPLTATDGGNVDLSGPGRHTVFVYPMTGRPDVALPEGWDEIPGARGCTPQACSFRDLHAELVAAGAGAVYGLSTQNTEYQREAAARLHLPYPLLSDHNLAFADDLGLPRFEADGKTLLKRMALILTDGVVEKVFYPVFPPDRNAGDVLAWLKERV